MKILITGADGYIGSTLATYFKLKGYAVIGTVFEREPEENEYFCNISKPSSIATLPTGPYDMIIHTAGIVDYSAGFAAMKAVNTKGARNMARWATQTGCAHFIHISSVSVYGFLTLGQQRTENYAWKLWQYVGNSYMRSKAAAEEAVRQENKAYTMLRLPAVIGAGDTFTSPNIFHKLQSGEFFFCGKGNKTVSLMSVKNLGFIIGSLFRMGPENNTYNCCDYHVAWRELVSEFAFRMGIEVPARKKAFLKVLSHLNDEGTQMLFTYSCFGSHFPDERLWDRIGDVRQYHWKERVREAVEALLKKEGRLSPP